MVPNPTKCLATQASAIDEETEAGVGTQAPTPLHTSDADAHQTKIPQVPPPTEDDENCAQPSVYKLDEEISLPPPVLQKSQNIHHQSYGSETKIARYSKGDTSELGHSSEKGNATSGLRAERADERAAVSYNTNGGAAVHDREDVEEDDTSSTTMSSLSPPLLRRNANSTNSPPSDITEDFTGRLPSAQLPGAVRVTGWGTAMAGEACIDNLADPDEQNDSIVAFQPQAMLSEEHLQEHIRAEFLTVVEGVDDSDSTLQRAKAVPLERRDMHIKILFLILIVSVGVLVVSLFFLIKSETIERPPSGSRVPSEFQNEGRLEPWLYFLGDVLSKPSVLTRSDTPQGQAVEWLQRSDTLLVSTDDQEYLITMFVLATVFYSTSGPSWYNGEGWLDSVATSPCGYYMQRQSIKSVLQVEVSLPFYEDTKYPDPLICDPNTGALVGLLLDENGLQGTLPTELGLLSNLQVLSMKVNSLTGTLPEELGRLTSLEVLDLAINNLEGTLPTSLANLSNLVELELFKNDLVGTFPPEYVALTSIEKLRIQANSLDGSLAAEICEFFDGRILDVGIDPFPRFVSYQGSSPAWGGAQLFLDCLDIDCPCCTQCCDLNMDGTWNPCRTNVANPLYELFQRPGT